MSQAYHPNFYDEVDSFATCGEKKCQAQGLQCKNCSTLVRCIEEEEGSGFVEVVIETCKTADGEYCYKDRGCSKEFNACCNAPPYTFKCNALGMFPDPYDCTKYHICTKSAGKLVDNVAYCSGQYGYNMITTYCDKKLAAGQCPDYLPVPLCEKESETGALENKSIWYMCVKQGNYIVPELHLCPHGECYNGEICVEPDQCSTSSSSSSAPTTEAPHDITTPSSF